MARMVLTSAGEDVDVGGNVEVMGTRAGGETVTVTRGDIILDPSFSAGGDVIILPGNSQGYTAVLVASRVVLSNGDVTVSVPVSPSGITLKFGDFQADLAINSTVGQVFLGDQKITTSAVAVGADTKTELIKVGSEIQVNEAYVDSDPVQISHFEDGSFVVIYSGYDEGLLQAFDTDGLKAGGEIKLEGVPGQEQLNIATLSDGNLLVTWTQEDSSDGGLVGRIFSSSGAALSNIIEISTENLYGQVQTSLAVASNGTFMVVWEDGSGAGGDTDSTAIKARVFDVDGQAITDEILVNTTTVGSQHEPDVSAVGDTFVVAWSHTIYSDDGATGNLKGQIFSQEGSRIGSELNLTDLDPYGQLEVEIEAGLEGGFVIAYNNDEEIMLQAFDADGNSVGASVQLSDGPSSLSHYRPDLALLSSGDLLVSWASSVGFESGSDYLDDSYNGVYGTIFDYSENVAGEIFKIDTDDTAFFVTHAPSISVGPGGEVVAVWGEDSRIRAQVFEEVSREVFA